MFRNARENKARIQPIREIGAIRDVLVLGYSMYILKYTM